MLLALQTINQGFFDIAKKGLVQRFITEVPALLSTYARSSARRGISDRVSSCACSYATSQLLRMLIKRSVTGRTGDCPTFIFLGSKACFAQSAGSSFMMAFTLFA
jgi:hypothetical protein